MISLRTRTFLCITISLLAPITAEAPRLKIKQRLLGKTGPATLDINGQQIIFSDATLKKMVESNEYLNKYNGTYFNVPMLKNPRKMRTFLRKKKKLGPDYGEPFCLEENGFKVHGTFFDRNSKYMAVVAGGFLNSHEYMAPFIKLFPNYDLLFFDLPGHGLEQGEATSTKGRIAQSLLGINFDVITFGDAEAQTIIAAVGHFKKKKKYTKVAGVARCYSVPFFAQAGVD